MEKKKLSLMREVQFFQGIEAKAGKFGCQDFKLK